jgi:hypothetical protein
MWASWIAVVVAGAMSYFALSLKAEVLQTSNSATNFCPTWFGYRAGAEPVVNGMVCIWDARCCVCCSRWSLTSAIKPMKANAAITISTLQIGLKYLADVIEEVILSGLPRRPETSSSYGSRSVKGLSGSTMATSYWRLSICFPTSGPIVGSQRDRPLFAAQNSGHADAGTNVNAHSLA